MLTADISVPLNDNEKLVKIHLHCANQPNTKSTLALTKLLNNTHWHLTKYMHIARTIHIQIHSFKAMFYYFPLSYFSLKKTFMKKSQFYATIINNKQCKRLMQKICKFNLPRTFSMSALLVSGTRRPLTDP